MSSGTLISYTKSYGKVVWIAFVNKGIDIEVILLFYITLKPHRYCMYGIIAPNVNVKKAKVLLYSKCENIYVAYKQWKLPFLNYEVTSIF